MIIRKKKKNKLNEDIAVQAATVSANAEPSSSQETSNEQSPLKITFVDDEGNEDDQMTEEEKKQKALEELDKKDDAEIMSMILSGKMPEDGDIRDKIFKKGNDFIQKQMTGTITPDKQKEIYDKILAGAGLTEEES